MPCGSFFERSGYDIITSATGSRIAVRETRRVKGRYVLTEEYAAKGRTFEDVIAWRSGYLDLTMGGKVQQNISGDKGVWGPKE